MTIASKLSLDFRGLVCPMPVVKLAQIVRQLEVGEQVECIATDPGVMSDVPAWARSTGNQVVCIEKREQEFHFIVRRMK